MGHQTFKHTLKFKQVIDIISRHNIDSILITGVGLGKTTLAKNLQEVFPRFVIIEYENIKKLRTRKGIIVIGPVNDKTQKLGPQMVLRMENNFTFNCE